MAKNPSFATGKRGRDSLQDGDDSNSREQGFLKKDRYASRQRKRQLDIDDHDSDSLESNSDSESESGRTGGKENDDEDNEDMFASDDEQKPIKKTKLEPESAKDALDYHDPKFEQDELFPEAQDKQDVQIESFNMEEEDARNESYDDMNDKYVKNEGKDREDQWIDEVEDVKGVAESQRRDKERREQKLNEIQKRRRHYMVDEALIRLMYFVNPGETVLTTLGRFNKLRNRGESVEYIVNAINFVTDLIDIIERKGIEDVYSLTRSDLLKLFKEESLEDSALIDDYKTKMWCFKWIKKPDVIHGEYTNYQMQYWKKSYFQQNVAAKICFEPNEPINWVHIDCLHFL